MDISDADRQAVRDLLESFDGEMAAMGMPKNDQPGFALAYLLALIAVRVGRHAG